MSIPPSPVALCLQGEYPARWNKRATSFSKENPSSPSQKSACVLTNHCEYSSSAFFHSRYLGGDASRPATETRTEININPSGNTEAATIPRPWPPKAIQQMIAADKNSAADSQPTARFTVSIRASIRAGSVAESPKSIKAGAFMDKLFLRIKLPRRRPSRGCQVPPLKQ